MKSVCERFASAPYMLEDLEDRRLLSFGPLAQLIHQDAAVANYASIDGTGYSIVDIDSGVDASHPNLSGKLLPGYNFFANNTDTTDDQGHGTMTAGILAASTWTSPSDGFQYQGVAPGAKVIPLKISETGASSVAFDQTVGKALYRVVSEVQTHPELHIAAVNLSLRTVDQSTYQSYLQKPLKLLHNLGIFVAAASGNDANTSGVDYPANDPYTFAVGGVNADDTVTPLTNRSSKIGLLAPGNGVPSLQPGGHYTVGGDGTSYATPYVTAAAVLVKQVNPAFTPDQIASILKQSGDPVSDPASGLTFERLDLNNAIALAYKQTGVGTPPTSSAYPFGVPHSIFSGSTTILQAEDFDNGGQGVGYYDLDKANRGGAYRNTRVDILPSSDVGGGYQVFSTKATEYLNYTVDVQAAGSYTLSARVASYLAGGTFHVELDGSNLTGPVTVPNTRGWAHWKTIGTLVTLPAGQHVLKLVMDRVGSQGVVGNFNWIGFTPTTPAAAQGARAAATVGASATSAETALLGRVSGVGSAFSTAALPAPWDDGDSASTSIF